MSRQNDDIEQLKASVSCALILERLQPDWRLDAAQSTRRNLKFRRGPGKIVIVNHDGRGWWDPLSAAKGDILSLAQYLDPSLDFSRIVPCAARVGGYYPDLAIGVASETVDCSCYSHRYPLGTTGTSLARIVYLALPR